jgi:hypothetical protein
MVFIFEKIDHFQNKKSEVSLNNQGISLLSTSPLAPTGKQEKPPQNSGRAGWFLFLKR